VEPFHSFQSVLVRHIYAADAILVGGYGFGDAHVNWALSNRLMSGQTRPPVMVLDQRPPGALFLVTDRWATDICRTLHTNGSCFEAISDITDRRPSGTASAGSFEIAKAHRIALWNGGFTQAAQRIDEIVAWLNTPASRDPQLIPKCT